MCVGTLCNIVIGVFIFFILCHVVFGKSCVYTSFYNTVKTQTVITNGRYQLAGNSPKVKLSGKYTHAYIILQVGFSIFKLFKIYLDNQIL